MTRLELRVTASESTRDACVAYYGEDNVLFSTWVSTYTDDLTAVGDFGRENEDSVDVTIKCCRCERVLEYAVFDRVRNFHLTEPADSSFDITSDDPCDRCAERYESEPEEEDEYAGYDRNHPDLVAAFERSRLAEEIDCEGAPESSDSDQD